MKLLTEVMDANEVYRIKILFESKGIPLFVSNENSAASLSFLMPARKYGIYVLYEEQFHDAKILVEDDTHVVENQIDMQAHQEYEERMLPDAKKQLFKWVLSMAVWTIIFCIAFVCLMSTLF